MAKRHFPSNHPPAHRSNYESTSIDGDGLTADDGDQRREGRRPVPGSGEALGNTPGPVWPDHGDTTGKL
jgi:hypothetical protein